MQSKRWNVSNNDTKAVQNLQQQINVSETICKLLVQRGITDFNSARDFFRPSLKNLHSPWLMKDMKKAVSRIERAITSSEKILVFGDYDVDGTTAVASFYQFISKVHDTALTEFYIPHRYREGYGVSKAGIDYAAEKKISLIVCLDCGIKSHELIDYATSLGIDFIICDHHLPGHIIPNAAAILNPKQADCNYPYKELCGCGIGFKLMSALAEHFSLEQEEYLCYLDLVATAIAADIVPMTGENRILAYHGLQKINNNPCPGIKALIELGGIKNTLDISNVVFVIAPRVNAAGRMDDAKKAVQLFIEKDETKAFAIGELLHSDNTERKETDTIITQEALEMISEDADFSQKKSTVLFKEDWHKGVVGIVASRIIEHYYKPTIVLTKSDDLATGSARSIKGFNLYEAIYECKEYLTNFGGHFAAAGLSLLPENVEKFAKKFEEVVSSTVTEDMLKPEIIIDTEIQFFEIKQPFYNILSQMEPFGPENLRPVFIAKKVTDTGNSRLLKDQHIKFELKQNGSYLSGIGFKMRDKFQLFESRQPIDIVFSIEENEWKDNKTLQLKVIDFRLSE